MNRRKGRKKLTSFLQKTYEIVNDSSNAEIVSWTSDGKAFTIKSIPEFTESILPKYFKHSNFASFVRQLNMYDFHKSRDAEADSTFHHPSFLKGKRKLLRQIRRKTAENYPEAQTNNVLSKSDCQKLLEKVQDLQREHQLLESTVFTLRSENRDMAVHNQDLMVELNAYKEREERLEILLRRFSGQLQCIAEGQPLEDPLELTYQDEPFCLMEDEQTAELEQPRSRLTDSSLDSAKSDSQDFQREYQPDSATIPPEDSEIDEELEQLLHPTA